MKLDLREIPAIYINLDKDLEKNSNMQQLLKNDCNFKNVLRLEASKYPERHLAGCSMSHFNALGELDPPFIIFEDDCVLKNWNPIIEVPDDADAVYLGISSWGRMNSHSGPCVQYEQIDKNLLRVYNMLSAHAVLYLSKEYVKMCSRISYHNYEISDYQDIGFAEIQRYFNVYAFDNPIFYQTSSNGTDQPLTTYPSIEIFQPNRSYWKPTPLY